MATLLNLQAGAIHRLDQVLEPGELEARVIFGTTDFRDWATITLPALKSTRSLDMTPQDQFDALAVDFCLGRELVIGPHFHALLPISKGVWELKSPDLRLFGWFPLKDHFIAVAGHHADG